MQWERLSKVHENWPYFVFWLLMVAWLTFLVGTIDGRLDVLIQLLETATTTVWVPDA
jgi:hypothetical protein